MQDKIHRANQVFQQLSQQNQSLILATSNEEGMPDASTVPFIKDEQGNYVILISQLAQHTRNIQANPRAAIMILEDEKGADNLFARKRIQLQCDAEIVDDTDYQSYAALMTETHGKTVDLLLSLPDFSFIRLQPVAGQFVMGFGQAYRLTGKNLDELELIAPRKPDQST